MFGLTEVHPYKKKLTDSEYKRVMKFTGIGSQECDDLGMADMAEVEAVRSYAYSHGQFTVKPVSKILQHFDTF